MLLPRLTLLNLTPLNTPDAEENRARAKQNKEAARKALSSTVPTGALAAPPATKSNAKAATSAIGQSLASGACSFQVQPAHAHFTDYAIGDMQELELTVFNTAKVSRGVRFLPPTSKYFSIAGTRFPTGSAIVAPGMSCTVRVAFCPDSLADYRDFISVCSETERYRIALVAKRAPPRLSLPAKLDAGSCFVGTSLSTSFECRNTGGPAKFQLLGEEEVSYL